MTSSTFGRNRTYGNSRYERSYGGPMLIQDGFYSPERTPNKDSTKLTPKSILKESTNSGFKHKKNIVINESLNETRKLSLRSESSDHSLEKRSKALASKAQDQQSYAQRPYTAMSSYGRRYNGYDEQPETSSQRQRAQENNRYEQSLRSPVYLENNRDTFGNSNSLYGADTSMSNTSKTNLTDFQRAHVRRLQKEKEQNKYSEIVRKGDLVDDEESNWRNNATKSNYSFADERRELQKKNNEASKNEQTRPGLNSRENGSQSQKGEGWNNIEDKIYNLEKNLDSYSKRLRESIERQRNRFAGNTKGSKPVQTTEFNAGLDKKKTEPNKNSQKKSTTTNVSVPEARRSDVSNKKASVTKQKAADVKENIPNSKTKPEKKQESEKNIESLRSSAGFFHTNTDTSRRLDQYNEGTGAYRRFDTDKYVKELQEEIANLRHENTYLRETYRRDNDEKTVTSKPPYKSITDNIFDKERELLKAVEQIRTKLHTSTSSRSFHDKLDETTPNKTSSKYSERPQVMGRSVSKDTVFHRMKMNNRTPSQSSAVRQAYGPKLLERENTDFLNLGVSTCYNGFHWNADKSLKLSRNI